MAETLERTVELTVGAAEAFAWHEREGALERMLPPWEHARVVARSGGGLQDGSRVTVSSSFGPVPVTMTAEHRDFRGGERFTDVQVDGPFARWEHVHEVIAREGGRCAWRDLISYELRGGVVGRAIAGSPVRRRLERALTWRHATLRDDLALHAALPRRRLRVAVTGATGLIGRTLCPLLTTGGHDVLPLSRGGDERLRWDPARGLAHPEALEGVDAVVHLAGENIATRWTPKRAAIIERSRVGGTRALVASLAKLKRPPCTFLCASAVGWYPSSDAVVDESTPPGTGFLAKVCRDWEEAAEGAAAFGARVVRTRFGIVLSPQGGALAKMLPAFRLGLGGPLGSGRQWQPFVSIDDAAAVILTALLQEDVAGPVNVVAPERVTNDELSRTLARVLHRPCAPRVPAFVLRAVFGGMADGALLASHRVEPRALASRGYSFRHATLEASLRHVLGRSAGGDGARIQ
jgi:uncharacterized protein (TIGR01777 family)